jgi:hypothetical protein
MLKGEDIRMGEIAVQVGKLILLGRNIQEEPEQRSWPET